MKFSLDLKVEFKKSLELYCQISVSVITKPAKHFVHFPWHNKSEQKAAKSV